MKSLRDQAGTVRLPPVMLRIGGAVDRQEVFRVN
jgi:hypothetical protein